MSDAAIRTSLGALGGGRGVFARDRRFFADLRGAGIPQDPVEAAFAQGYGQGAEDARAAAMAASTTDDAARYRIETALVRMEGDALDQFRDRLRATVLALCETVLTPAAIEPAALAARVEAAAAMFARAADERVIRLHPEDLALIHARLPEAWHCDPDPTLERGAIRVENAGGGVEDGPAQWRGALEEALLKC